MGDRCARCEYRRETKSNGGWMFFGCYHNPYKGMWVAEIKDCPKENKRGGNMTIAEYEDYLKLMEENQRLNDKIEVLVETILQYKEERQIFQAENAKLRDLLKKAAYIMWFHTQRCPMDIMHNFSGSDEHLAEYRGVMKALQALESEA